MKYFISLLLLVTFVSCSEDSDPPVYETEDDIIQYLDENNITATRTDNGVYYAIDIDGNGQFPNESSKITFSYKLMLLDGSVIEESEEEGIQLILSNLLSGLSEGLVYFDEGSEGTIFIPPALGFGYVDRNDIPAGSVLIFEVKILDVLDPEEEILQYLEDNNLEAEKSEIGLYYIVDEPGEGDPITETSVVTVAYTGYLIDGTEFDASGDIGVKFDLSSNLIPGFKEGITYFKEGGKGKLLIPPALGYGTEGTGAIPGNAVLIFDIEVKTLHN